MLKDLLVAVPGALASGESSLQAQAHAARSAGATWNEIAEAVGLTRNEAERRWQEPPIPVDRASRTAWALDGADRNIESAEYELVIAAVLEDLAPEDAEAFRMHLSGYSRTEIARTVVVDGTTISPQAWAVRLRPIEERIRKALDLDGARRREPRRSSALP